MTNTPTAERLTLSGNAFMATTVQQHLQRYKFASNYVAGKSVLDIACGTGYGSAMLADAGASAVTGIDVSAEAVNTARRDQSRRNVTFRTGDAQRLTDLADASFDVIVSFETIEHVRDDGAYLDEMRRLLKPDGVFLVSTPDGRLESTLFGLTGKPRSHYHLREYVGDQFARLLNTQFEVQEMYGQVFVGRLWVPWPVQVAVKGFERLTRPLKVFRGVVSRYHTGSGVHVQPASQHPNRIAKYWVAVCRRRG